MAPRVQFAPATDGSAGTFNAPPAYERAESRAEALTFEQQLASYVPAHVVFEMLDGEVREPPSKPERQDFEGAVAFVDISGFTALSEKLKEQYGKGGSEKLNVYINAYFEKLISEAYSLKPPHRNRAPLKPPG